MQRILFVFIGLLSTFAHANPDECHSVKSRATKFYYENYEYFFKEMPLDRLSPEFSDLIKKELDCSKEQICAIDWDVWTGAQDGDIVGKPEFKIQNGNARYSRVTVILKLKNGVRNDGTEAVTYPRTTIVLKKPTKNSCWLVDDHILTNGQSLKEILQESLTGSSK